MGVLLARKGWKVELYEKQRSRHVVCGGLINNRTLTMFPELEEFVINRIDGAIIGAGGEELVVRRRRVAWVLDRDAMFGGLLDLAQSEGVDVFFREWRGGNYRALVGADGATSTVRSLVTHERVNYIVGFQVDVEWDGDERFVRVDFGPWSDVFFGWVIPLGDGRAHVGIGLSLNASGAWRRYLRLYANHVGVKIVRGVEGRVIPVSRPLKRIVKGNVLLVGDAAVHTKASTGGGISYGLIGIKGAAEYIDSYLAEEGNLEGFNTYHRLYIYPRLFLHYFIHRFYNRVPMEHVIRNIKEEGLVDYLEREGDMDDPYFLLKNPRVIFRNASLFFRTLLAPS